MKLIKKMADVVFTPIENVKRSNIDNFERPKTLYAEAYESDINWFHSTKTYTTKQDFYFTGFTISAFIFCSANANVSINIWIEVNGQIIYQLIALNPEALANVKETYQIYIPIDKTLIKTGSIVKIYKDGTVLGHVYFGSKITFIGYN
jgi:hypothetical protein